MSIIRWRDIDDVPRTLMLQLKNPVYEKKMVRKNGLEIIEIFKNHDLFLVVKKANGGKYSEPCYWNLM